MVIYYQVDHKGRPFSAPQGQHKGVMRIHIDLAFQHVDGKCQYVVARRKLMKFILNAGSEENINELRNWLMHNSAPWFREFEKLTGGQ